MEYLLNKIPELFLEDEIKELRGLDKIKINLLDSFSTTYPNKNIDVLTFIDLDDSAYAIFKDNTEYIYCDIYNDE